jgi:hypothetical protein
MTDEFAKMDNSRRKGEINPFTGKRWLTDEERAKKRDDYLRSNGKHPRSPFDKSWENKKPATGYDVISFEVDVVSLADHIARTVISKQKDYGPNNIRRSPYGAQAGLVVRLYDKVARLANLTGKDAKPENESLRDTFVDIAGYAIIGLMLIDGTFPKEQ